MRTVTSELAVTVRFSVALQLALPGVHQILQSAAGDDESHKNLFIAMVEAPPVGLPVVPAA